MHRHEEVANAGLEVHETSNMNWNIGSMEAYEKCERKKTNKRKISSFKFHSEVKYLPKDFNCPASLRVTTRVSRVIS